MPRKLHKEELGRALKDVDIIRDSFMSSNQCEQINKNTTNLIMESMNDLHEAINDIIFKTQMNKEFDVEKAAIAARESVFRDELKHKDHQIERLKAIIASRKSISSKNNQSINELFKSTMYDISKINDVSMKLRKRSMGIQNTKNDELIGDLENEIPQLKTHLNHVLEQLSFYEIHG